VRKFTGRLMVVVAFAGWAGAANAGLIEYVIEGDLRAWTNDEDNLDGAHFVWTSTIDTVEDFIGARVGSNISSPSWWGWWSSSVIEIADRPGGSPDVLSNVSPYYDYPGYEYAVATHNYWEDIPNQTGTDHLQFFAGYIDELPGLRMHDYGFLFDITFWSGRDPAALPIDVPYISEDNHGWVHPTDDGNISSYYFIDSLTLTASAVPTPATLALFSIGLAGLGWSRRKKV
jgi:hypothetical protein